MTEFVTAEETPFDSVSLSISTIKMEVYGAHIKTATGETANGVFGTREEASKWVADTVLALYPWLTETCAGVAKLTFGSIIAILKDDPRGEGFSLEMPRYHIEKLL